MGKKRYAHVGIGGRAIFWYEALVGKYSDTSELVGFCDINRSRMEYANKRIKESNNKNQQWVFLDKR